MRIHELFIRVWSAIRRERNLARGGQCCIKKISEAEGADRPNWMMQAVVLEFSHRISWVFAVDCFMTF